MRTPARESRIQAYSIPEISQGLELAVARIAGFERFQGHKLQKGHVVNAVMHQFLILPPDEQEEIVRDGLREFERLLELKVPERPSGITSRQTRKKRAGEDHG